MALGPWLFILEHGREKEQRAQLSNQERKGNERTKKMNEVSSRERTEPRVARVDR
jgi:hypothetical protein